MLMRTLSLIFCLLFSLTTIAQGKYAGPVFKQLLYKTYQDNRKIGLLKGFRFMQENRVSDLRDSLQLFANVFKQGPTIVVFFSMLKDTGRKLYSILDVLEIKDPDKGWQVHTVFCRKDKKSDVNIVALAQHSGEDYLNTIKQAWIFDRVKRKFESIPTTGIDCFNEGGE